VQRVEARISQKAIAPAGRVAVNAGFEFGTSVPPIAGTGQIADNMLYVLNPGPAGVNLSGTCGHLPVSELAASA
jgi:hypothetical protein